MNAAALAHFSAHPLRKFRPRPIPLVVCIADLPACKPCPFVNAYLALGIDYLGLIYLSRYQAPLRSHYK